jgi:hypothetical protein
VSQILRSYTFPSIRPYISIYYSVSTVAYKTYVCSTLNSGYVILFMYNMLYFIIRHFSFQQSIYIYIIFVYHPDKPYFCRTHYKHICCMVLSKPMELGHYVWWQCLYALNIHRYDLTLTLGCHRFYDLTPFPVLDPINSSKHAKW